MMNILPQSPTLCHPLFPPQLYSTNLTTAAAEKHHLNGRKSEVRNNTSAAFDEAREATKLTLK
jgi:hypothetical protein